MRMEKLPTWRNLRERGFIGVNGLMAAFSALVALSIMLLAAWFVLAMLCAFIFGPPPTGSILSGLLKYGIFESHATTFENCQAGHPDTCIQKAISPAEIKYSGTDIASIVLGVVIPTLPAFMLSFGLIRASACFVGLARGEFFSRKTIARLRDFALAGLLFLLAQPHINRIAQAASDLVERIGRPGNVIFGVNHIAANLSINGLSNLLVFIYALTLTVIAFVLARASAIAEDHAQIV